MQKSYEKQCKIMSCVPVTQKYITDIIELAGFGNCAEITKHQMCFYLLNVYFHHIFLFYPTFTCNCATQTYHMTSTCILIHKKTIIYNLDIKSFCYKWPIKT